MLLAGRVKVLVYKELSSREIIPNLNLNDLKKLLFNISMFDDQINKKNKQNLKKIFIKWWEEYLSSHPKIDEDAPPYNIIVAEFQQIFLKMFNELFNEYNIIIELVELKA